MKITFVVAAIDNSGGFRVIATLSRKLLERGHDVTIVCPARPRLRLKAKINAFFSGKPGVRRQWHSDHLGTSPEHVHWVDHPSPLTDEDIPDGDIVIGTWWDTMHWVARFSARKGLKMHLVQDYEVWGANDEKLVDTALRYPGTKFAISRYLQMLLTEKFGQQDVVLLLNAVDDENFFAPLRDKGSAFSVGFAYSPDPRKGSDLIIAALERARETLPEMNVIAFGHAAPQSSIPVPDWVDYRVSPPQHELRMLYAKCQVWLFGSRREGFGLPILEAMACRTPVIGMPAGAAPDLLCDGCGILVAEQDWHGMADAIVEVAAMSDAAWYEMSRRAYTRATGRTWDLTCDEFETALAERLKGNHAFGGGIAVKA